MTPETCRLCGGPLVQRWAEIPVAITPPLTRPVLECDRCGAWALELPPGVGDESYYESKPASDHAVLETGVKRFQRVHRAVREALGREPESVLDVGSAQGAHLAEYPEAVRKLAIEPSASAIEALTARGITWVGPYLGQTPDVTAEAVTCIDVLEHVTEPLALLRDLDAAVSPGGILVIVTGDSRSIPALIAGRRWQYIGLPEHTSVFSWASLKPILVDDLGYVVIKRTAIPNEDPGLRYFARFAVGTVRELAFRLLGEGTMKRLESQNRAWFPYFFDNLMVVLRKRLTET